MTAPQTNNADLTKGKLRHFLRLCYLVVAVTVAVQAYCIYEKTVINGWILLAAALSVAIVTLPLRNSWKWLVVPDNGILRTACHLFLVTTFCTAFVLDGNYYLPSGPEATRREQASVVSKHTKERQMTRRAGKYRYVANGVRRSYFRVWLSQTDRKKPFPYRRRSTTGPDKEESKKLMLTKGIFGLTVITGGLSGKSRSGRRRRHPPGPAPLNRNRHTIHTQPAVTRCPAVQPPSHGRSLIPLI